MYLFSEVAFNLHLGDLVLLSVFHIKKYVLLSCSSPITLSVFLRVKSYSRNFGKVSNIYNILQYIQLGEI